MGQQWRQEQASAASVTSPSPSTCVKTAVKCSANSNGATLVSLPPETNYPDTDNSGRRGSFLVPARLQSTIAEKSQAAGTGSSWPYPQPKPEKARMPGSCRCSAFPGLYFRDLNPGQPSLLHCEGNPSRCAHRLIQPTEFLTETLPSWHQFGSSWQLKLAILTWTLPQAEYQDVHRFHRVITAGRLDFCPYIIKPLFVPYLQPLIHKISFGMIRV